MANDIAAVLGYADCRQAVSDHCKSAILLKGVESTPLTTSPRGITIIPERDVYRLIMRSKLPSAERFEEWVVGEVLPSIRKTGGYSLQLPKTYSEALRMLADSVDREETNRPKVAAFDTFLGAKNSQTMNEVAKSLNIGRNKLFSILRNELIVMRNNLPFQRYIDSGYFTVKETFISQCDENKAQTLVTAKGVAFIHNLLKQHNLIST